MAIRFLRIAFLGLALLAPLGGSQAADKVLRVVPHADLKVLDPHTNTATITLMHGAMIYDTLFSWDSKLQPKPQMVEAYHVSPDRLVYTFTLRTGLKFHDGQPVTTRDVIPSIKRWIIRNTLGQTLAKFIEAIDATDDKTFVIRLKEPFAFVEMALGAHDAVIMREKDAATDPFKAVTETVGSGPFRFVHAEWNPGAKVYTRKTPTTSRAPSLPTVWQAAKRSESIASNGRYCPIPLPNRPHCSRARST
jgi:peptide/nickel transport system substrate-binding protein